MMLVNYTKKEAYKIDDAMALKKTLHYIIDFINLNKTLGDMWLENSDKIEIYKSNNKLTS